MGALLVAGLAMAGAAIGIAQIAANARGGMGPTAALIRATAIVGMAFAQGIGILGTVVGLLAIFAFDAGDASSGSVEALVGGAGALVGLALVARAGDAVDSRVRLLGLLYIMGSATLGIVVGVLASTTWFGSRRQLGRSLCDPGPDRVRRGRHDRTNCRASPRCDVHDAV